MRHIDYNPSSLTLPDGWTDTVKNLEAQLLAEIDAKKRAELIDKNDDVWKAIKQELAKLFNFKCWYTESPQQGTDVDVDHYRPKKRVAEVNDKDNPHPGYWWLSFKLENYRYSCIVANRRRRDVETDKTGGKADHFPIWNEQNRAWTPTCDCDEEQPILLDPCKAADVALITFKDDGEAMARYGCDAKPRLFQRADISIKYYNLNHSDFVRARIELREKMDGLVRDADKFYKKLETGDATHDHAYETTIKTLRRMRDKFAPYSSFCMAYLDKYRHEDFLVGVFL
ncbi:MAG: hypothetical protein Q8L79_19795 [Methylobacter sp.]|uniref:hypothetical protein n=1 Tax=Methylobacter sp. TaxID=2051955 RepID=UPI00273058C9|nr:hypothetical protein [Methylobacter sp.]MDP1667356.1 hypothetical protein [Methylobacter sp.]